ncbi:MAG: tRNA (adenosine(37)-N6)-threonylcarbamoyltransferase complex ATPase subunit type 1 TsaE [Planctomycetota bacterium]
MRFEERTASVGATMRLGRALARRYGPGRVYALEGELGAGKTILAKGLAAGFGVTDPDTVTSPTFTLMHRYDGADGQTVHHADLYRLTGPDDAAAIGLEELLAAGATVIIEWAERVRELLGPGTVWINARHDGERARRFTVTAGDKP